MALAIDASTPAQATGTGATLVTASFTPPTGALLLVMYTQNDPGTNDCSISTVTNSGTAITWTRRARKTTNASSTGGAGTNAGVDVWTGVMGTSAALTVTATPVTTPTGVSHEKTLQIMVLTGANTSSLSNVTAAFSASGLPSVALAGCTAGSYVFAVSSDWAQKGLGTAGTAQTIISESNVSGQISTHNWRTTSVLAGSGSQTMNLTAVSAQQYNLAVIEILDAGGAAAPIINLTMAPITGY